MTKIIIDTNIILRQPKILGLKIPDTQFLVPIEVLNELQQRAIQRGASTDKRIDLIEAAFNQGTITLVNSDAPSYRQFKELLNSSKLGGADIAIVAIALSLANKGEVIKIATQDKAIWDIASQNNIGVLSESDIENLLTTFIGKNVAANSIQREIVTYEKKEYRDLLLGILTGIATTIGTSIIYKNIHQIVATINIWGTITATLCAGIILFIFREKQRFSYGVFEFLIGVATIIVPMNSNNFDYNKIDFNIDFDIRLLGGLYITVRGQDNIVKALKDTKVGLFLKDSYGIGR